MWNESAFSFKKSIGTVRFVPLLEMSVRDWLWLDFENTRIVAQNRIAGMSVKGKLKGFFQVMITQKAKAKHEYFWPGDQSMYDEFASSPEVTVDSGGASGVPSKGTAPGSAASFFTNTKEEDAAAVEKFDKIKRRLSTLTPWMVLVFMYLVEEQLDNEDTSNLESLIDEYVRTENLNLLAAITMLMLDNYTADYVDYFVDDLSRLIGPATDEFARGTAKRLVAEVNQDAKAAGR